MTDSLKLLIADDEAPARNRLRELLSEVSYVAVVAEAKNGREAIDLIDSHAIDIALLDIRMPIIDGIEVAQHIQKTHKPPAIIFTTAFDSYAMQAFDMNAMDYLLKPIRLERLQSAINKARTLQNNQLNALKPLMTQRSHFSVMERGRILLVPISEVIYLRAELKYITVRTVEREYLIEESLTHLEQEFHNIFIRLHRNCLVASNHILGFEKRAGSYSELLNDTEKSEKQWHALLKGVPETICVSRRQQHLVRGN